MKEPHRLDGACPRCGYSMGVYSWLKARVNAFKDPEKRWSTTTFSVVTSLCPECGCASWAHYSDDLLAEVGENPSSLDALIVKYEPVFAAVNYGVAAGL